MNIQTFSVNSLPTNDNLNPYAFVLDVNGELFVRKGKMIAYYGAMRFESLGNSMFLQLVTRCFSAPAFAGQFTIVTGQGRVIVADNANYVCSYDLQDGNLTVKSEHVLAFHKSLVCHESVVPGYLCLMGTGTFVASSNGPVHFIEAPARVDEQSLLGWADLPCPSFRYDYRYAQRGVLAAAAAVTGFSSTKEERQLDFFGKGTIILQSSEEPLKGRTAADEVVLKLAGMNTDQLREVQSAITQRLRG